MNYSCESIYGWGVRLRGPGTKRYCRTFDFKVQQYGLNLHPYRDGYREICPVHGVGVAVAGGIVFVSSKQPYAGSQAYSGWFGPVAGGPQLTCDQTHEPFWHEPVWHLSGRPVLPSV
jgi:hypothetical protein